ncbi:hypothetical protein PG993_007117 [Apiospora rasikravindrae]|uniref:Uncharacterized protein n=1 Tax=Apiospora rasikravindrae TaxID=990691 RepID=A0ABR1SXZ9_9PEZI
MTKTTFAKQFNTVFGTAPKTLFPYDTMVPRAVETTLSDNLDMFQFDMGDGIDADSSLPNELM